MRHTPAQLIASIDRHAPQGWRRSPIPDPRLLVLSELGIFALSSTAFSHGHLWNEVWADPAVGFPMMTARAAVRDYFTANPDQARGVIHFSGHGFASEIGKMRQLGQDPDHLKPLIDLITIADDVFQDAELFWADHAVRLRFITE